MVSKAGAGPEPIPIAKLTAENLAGAILQVLGREMQAKAEVMGDSIRSETGSLNGARGFLRSVEQMGLGRCDILADRVAVWSVRGTDIKLSALAASALVEAKLLDGGYAALKLWRHREWEVNHGPLEPITGGAGALMGTIGSIVMGVGDFPKDMLKLAKAGKGKAAEGHIGPLPENRSVESTATTTTTTTASGASTSTTPASFLSEKEVVAGEKEAAAGEKPVGEPSTAAVDKGKGRDNVGFEISEAIAGTKSVSKIVGAGLRSPMDFTLGIAQGFRNAPKLYGDEIRPETRVTGFHSGLKAAGKVRLHSHLARSLLTGVTGIFAWNLRRLYWSRHAAHQGCQRRWLARGHQGRWERHRGAGAQVGRRHMGNPGLRHEGGPPRIPEAGQPLQRPHGLHRDVKSRAGRARAQRKRRAAAVHHPALVRNQALESEGSSQRLADAEASPAAQRRWRG